MFLLSLLFGREVGIESQVELVDLGLQQGIQDVLVGHVEGCEKLGIGLREEGQKLEQFVGSTGGIMDRRDVLVQPLG